MADTLHPLAAHHLPAFIPAADGSDPLMTIMLVVLIVGAIAVGSFYLHLHSLPERLAHHNNRVQLEFVAVLCLLALFTHNNWFWVLALLLAFVRLPDFNTPLDSMSRSLAVLAETRSREAPPSDAEPPEVAVAATAPAEPTVATPSVAPEAKG